VQANRFRSIMGGRSRVAFFMFFHDYVGTRVMSATLINTISQEERQQLRQTVEQASEPIAPFWPMRTMVAQNPIHGLEYLPFDQAVRKGKRLVGGNGYLPNEEYQQFYRDGRITPESLKRAFARVGPRPEKQDSVQIGSRRVTALDIWALHLVHGFEPCETTLLQWELSGGGATKRFRQDLSDESRQRIIERTIRECEHCRDYPEEAYLTNLWKSTLAVLQLSEAHSSDQTSGSSLSGVSDDPHAQLNISLPAQRTLSDWVDVLAGTTLVESINGQLIKWVAAFLDEGLAGWEMPLRHEGFYRAWRELVQQDHSGTFLGIKDFSQKIHELPNEPEDAVVASLHRLGIPQEEWKDYLSRQLSLLPGWTRYIRWLGENPAYHERT